MRISIAQSKATPKAAEAGFSIELTIVSTIDLIMRIVVRFSGATILKSGGSVLCGLVVRTASLSVAASSSEAMNRAASQCARRVAGDVNSLEKGNQY